MIPPAHARPKYKVSFFRIERSAELSAKQLMLQQIANPARLICQPLKIITVRVILVEVWHEFLNRGKADS